MGVGAEERGLGQMQHADDAEHRGHHAHHAQLRVLRPLRLHQRAPRQVRALLQPPSPPLHWAPGQVRQSGGPAVPRVGVPRCDDVQLRDAREELLRERRPRLLRPRPRPARLPRLHTRHTGPPSAYPPPYSHGHGSRARWCTMRISRKPMRRFGRTSSRTSPSSTSSAPSRSATSSTTSASASPYAGQLVPQL